MPPALQPSRSPGIALLVITLGLALGEPPMASAMRPPAPGLRVVWEKDGSIAGDGAMLAAPSLAEGGHWPRVDRIDARSAARPAAMDAGQGLDVRGRQLPDRRSAESTSP